MNERLKLDVLLPGWEESLRLRFDSVTDYSRFTLAVTRMETVPILVTRDEGTQLFLRPASVIGYATV